MYRKSFIACSALSAALLFTTSCEVRFNDRDDDRGHDGETELFTRTIAASEEIDALDTKIEMGAGVLRISGTDDYVLDSRFEVENEEDVDITYEEFGGKGEIEVSQSKDFDIEINDNNHVSDEWNIKLNRRIAQDMEIMLGAGKSKLDLAGFNLRDVTITMGAGENDIDMHDSSPERLVVEAGVGDVRVDLSGKWKNDCRIDVSGGIGQLVLILPSDAEIELEVNGGLGSVSAPDLEKDGRDYYQKGKGPKLRIEVNAGIGSLDVMTR